MMMARGGKNDGLLQGMLVIIMSKGRLAMNCQTATLASQVGTQPHRETKTWAIRKMDI
jgi:hypothetical protein